MKPVVNDDNDEGTTLIDVQDKLASRYMLTLSHFHEPTLVFVRDGVYYYFAQRRFKPEIGSWGVHIFDRKSEKSMRQMIGVVRPLGEEPWKLKPKSDVAVRREFQRAAEEVKNRKVPLRAVAIPESWEEVVIDQVEQLHQDNSPVGVYVAYQKESFHREPNLNFLRDDHVWFKRTQYYTLTKLEGVIRKYLLEYVGVYCLRRPSREKYEVKGKPKLLSELTVERERHYET